MRVESLGFIHIAVADQLASKPIPSTAVSLDIADPINIALLSIAGAALIAWIIILRQICIRSKENRRVADQPAGTRTDLQGGVAQQPQQLQLSWKLDPSEVEIGALIGQGSLGTVHQGKWKSIQVAVKVIHHMGNRENLENDLRSLIRVRHPRLVLFMGIAVLDDPRPNTASTPTSSSSTDTAFRLRAGSISSYVSIEQYLNITTNPEPTTPVLPPALPLHLAPDAVAGSGASLAMTPTSARRSSTRSEIRRRSSEQSVSLTMNPGEDAHPSRTRTPTSDRSATPSTSNSTRPLQQWFKRGKSTQMASVMFIVTEYMQRGSLQNCLLDTSLHLPWSRRIDLALDVARAMHYLHCMRPPVIHRHLSSANVLVDQDLTAKVSDYGLDSIRKVATSRGVVVEEPYWCAPEVLKSGRYSSASDVYAFGMILWELLTRSRPHFEAPGSPAYGQNHVSTPRQLGGSTSGSSASVNYVNDIKAIIKGARPVIPPATPSEMTALIQACWQHDPRKRPNFKIIIDVLTHVRDLSFDVSHLDPVHVSVMPFTTRAITTAPPVESKSLNTAPPSIPMQTLSSSAADTPTNPVKPTPSNPSSSSAPGGAGTKPSDKREGTSKPQESKQGCTTTSIAATSTTTSTTPSLTLAVTPSTSASSRPAPTPGTSSKSPSPEQGSAETKVISLPQSAALSAAPWLITPDELVYENRIGAGSFGEVFSGTFRGKKVAIKKLASIDDLKWNEFAHELSIMCTLRHPSIVLFMGACLEPGNQCLVMEMCEHGSLYDYLHDTSQVVDYRRILNILTSIAEAMAYLHSNDPPILHRDLKSSNILLDESLNARVSDFGLTRFKPRRKGPIVPKLGGEGATSANENAYAGGTSGNPKPRLIIKPSAKEQQQQQQKDHQTAPRTTQPAPQLMGTLLWQAPEVLEHQRYTQSSDVYSFGIIIWELFTRRVPFAEMNPHQATLAVVLEDARPPIPAFIPPKFKELIEACWHRDPAVRPDFPSIIQQLKQLEKLGLPRVNLTPENAKFYAKKAAVYAFVSRDVVIVNKPWGIGESKRGDYVIVGPNDDVYTCDATVFKNTYVPVDDPKAKNKYKKAQLILAVQQQQDFLIETLEGMEHGLSGDYIAQNPQGGEQWPISRNTFEEMYELVDPPPPEALLPFATNHPTILVPGVASSTSSAIETKELTEVSSPKYRNSVSLDTKSLNLSDPAKRLVPTSSLDDASHRRGSSSSSPMLQGVSQQSASTTAGSFAIGNGAFARRVPPLITGEPKQ